MRQGFNLWMITILFASVIVISAATPPDPVVHWKQHFSNRHARETFSNAKHNISDRASQFPSSRFRRNPNDDAFSTLQSRISSLARIVSGVTLYNGLVDGSIPVDEAISELMNIGSFSLDDLVKLEEKKVNGFAGELKTASAKMSDNPRVIETAMKDLVKIKKMWSEVGDLNTLPDNSMFEELKSMKSLDLKDIEDFKLTDTIQKLRTIPVSDVSTIKSELVKIDALSANVLAFMKDKNRLTTLAGMTPFHEYANLLNYLDNSNPMGKLFPGDVNQFKDDIKILQEIGNVGTSIFQIMNGITLSQSGDHYFDRKHTTGFVNGYVDLKNLPKDSNDTWLRENFRWLELTDGLTTISKLENGMETLNQKWSGLGTNKIRRAVQQAEFFDSNLKGISDMPNQVDTLVTQLNTFPAHKIDYAYSRSLLELSRDLLELLEIGKAIQEISTILKDNRNLVTNLDASNLASLASVISLLEALQPHIEVLQRGKTVEELTKHMIDRPMDYTEVKTAASSISYQSFLNALKNHKGDNLNKAATTAEIAILIRELKTDTDFSKHIGTASSIVFGSSSSVESIRTTMGDIKKSSAANNQTFSQLKDLQKFSKPLGDSSAVIDKIRKVLEKEDLLVYFVNNGDLVKQLAESKAIADIVKDIAKKHWDVYDDVVLKSKILLEGVKKRKDGVTKPSDDKLESYGPTIEGLDGLGDVILNVDKRIMAISVLLPSITDKNINTRLDSLKNSLTGLAYLDLTFARQSSSLKGMSQVLAGINDVFLGTTPTTTTKKPAERIQTGNIPYRGQNEIEFAHPRWEKWYETGYSYDDYFNLGIWNCHNRARLHEMDETDHIIQFCSRDTIREIAIWVGTGVGIACVIFSGLSGYVLWRERKQEEKEEAELKQKKEKPKRKKTRKTKKSTSKSTETARPSGRVQLVAPPAPAPAPPPPAPVPAAVFPVVPVAPPPAAPVGPAPVPRPEVVAAPPPNPNPAPVQGPAPAAAPVPNPAPVPAPVPAPQAPAQNPNPNPAQNPDRNHGAAQQVQNEEYFEEQNEDETLRCVKSIEN